MGRSGGRARAGGARRPARRTRRGLVAPADTAHAAHAAHTAHTAARGGERLQKILARAGLASRRQAETWIRAGRLTINGALATLGSRVLASDQVRLDGRRVRAGPAAPAAAAAVFLCHRSPGEAMAMPASAAAGAVVASRPAMLERLPRRSGRRFIAVSPMPRVDGGIELVSADGELAARLQRAVHALASRFGVRVRGALTEAQVQGIASGTLDSGAQLQVAGCEAAGGEGSNRWYTVTLRGASGKQVRQLFERQGALVSRVLRTQLGPLQLERALARGQFRALTQEELAALLPPAAAAG
jgi:23S rRNA pseudouridine2605 synthase